MQCQITTGCMESEKIQKLLAYTIKLFNCCQRKDSMKVRGGFWSNKGDE